MADPAYVDLQDALDRPPIRWITRCPMLTIELIDMAAGMVVQKCPHHPEPEQQAVLIVLGRPGRA